MADMVLVLCIVMSAYFIRGITGFGSGLISVPLLALSQPLHFAIPLVLALDFTASVILGSTNNKKANWSEIKVLLPAGMVGACIGAFALLSLPNKPVLVPLGLQTENVLEADEHRERTEGHEHRLPEHFRSA